MTDPFEVPRNKVVVVKTEEAFLLFKVENCEKPQIPGYPAFCFARFRPDDDYEKQAHMTRDRIEWAMKQEYERGLKDGQKL